MKLTPQHCLSLLIPFACLQKTLCNPITLVPAIVDSSTEESGPTTLEKQEILEEDLRIDTDLNLVCNSQLCYPLEFEPLTEWQEIKPKQIIPKGLDIRINMDTGKKEAKLAAVGVSSDTDVTFSATDEQNALAAQEHDLKQLNNEQDLHEFVSYFEEMQQNIDENNLPKIIDTLDTLMEFSHDYKHGYKLIKYEQPILMELIFHDNTNLQIVEMTTRLIAACLRNNPPAIEAFYPTNVEKILEALMVFKNQTVIKRFINILQNVAPKASNMDQLYGTLMHVYFSTTDQDIKIKILDILSTLELNTPHTTGKSIMKRSTDSDAVKVWFNEYCKQIQQEDLDEFHIRKFYKTLAQLKQETGFKIEDKSFMNWVSEQAVQRRKHLESGVDIEQRDLEQDDFNKEFIEARHAVFGNPMAKRIKDFQDEL
ncbi:hypothetical protein ACO0QE_003197 [Hanseniaspora vineae]